MGIKTGIFETGDPIWWREDGTGKKLVGEVLRVLGNQRYTSRMGGSHSLRPVIHSVAKSLEIRVTEKNGARSKPFRTPQDFCWHREGPKDDPKTREIQDLISQAVKTRKSRISGDS